MPQLTFINNHAVDMVINPLQAITYCLIGALILSAVYVGQLTSPVLNSNPVTLSGVLAGSELSVPQH